MRYLAVLAYEWRGNFLKSGDPQGDRVIYSRTSEIPYYSGAEKNYGTEKKLNDALKDWMDDNKDRKVMTIAHHTPHTLMGMKTDWSYFDPEMSRLVEIYSVHGSSEMSKDDGNDDALIGGTKEPVEAETDDSGYHIKDALSMGYHLGFMASGDSHDGHIGHSISHNEARHLWQAPLSWAAYSNHMFRCNHWLQNGLIGVFAEKNSRSSIFDGMWNRACYAIKGISRPYINFSINGTTIGESESIIDAPSINSMRDVRIDVAAGGGDGNYLKKIEIIRNNEVWKKIDLLGERRRVYHGRWLDNDTIEGINYWDYAEIDADKMKDGNKYFITDEADVGVDSMKDMSTDGEMFYYVKLYTKGSQYYNKIFDDYNVELVERGDDIAWVGPLWINPK